MSLTDKAVQSAKAAVKDYKLRDRDNMYLTVTKKGKKYWRMDYRFDGKRQTITFGQYPEIRLKEARERCSETGKLISQGTDPKASPMVDSATRTFKEVGQEWYTTKIAGLSESHSSRTLRMLEKELYPHIGHRPVDEITTPELLQLCRNIEKRGVIDTAHRAKQTAGQVFDFATQCGDTNTNPARQMTGALKPKSTTHYPSITDPVGVGRLMMAIDGYTGSQVVRTALKLSPLLFLRPGELRHLEWVEINFDTDQILIPGRKMKMGLDHIVPLSRQAKHQLQQIQRLTGDYDFVFPSPRGKTRPLSDNAVRTALRTMGYYNETLVPHGFRAMARTLLDEELEFNIIWIEQQLAHVVKDANGRAYNRTTHLRQRKEMMQRWADYLDELKQRASGSNIAYLPNTTAIS